MIGRDRLETQGLVALLPGSRGGELRRHLPLFRSAAEALGRRSDVKGFFLPTLPGLKEQLTAEVASWPVPVRIVSERAERLALYEQTSLAIACAGTATLELAMAGVPMVVTYVMDGFQARKYAEFGRPRVGLPNIILGADTTPELILGEPGAASVIKAATALLDDAEGRQGQLDAFARLRHLMDAGALGFPRVDAADRVLSHIKRFQK
jgi:lipid-A-disaccharide synthase